MLIFFSLFWASADFGSFTVSTPLAKLASILGSAGESVLIAVADSGPGFSEEAAQKAFEPFYTTKAGGMGLGLAMCRTILAAHDGDIRVATSPGPMGGDVTIRLPCAIAAFAGTREPSRTL